MDVCSMNLNYYGGIPNNEPTPDRGWQTLEILGGNLVYEVAEQYNVNKLKIEIPLSSIKNVEIIHGENAGLGIILITGGAALNRKRLLLKISGISNKLGEYEIFFAAPWVHANKESKLIQARTNILNAVKNAKNKR